MQTLNIKMNGETVVLTFNYKLLRLLGELWGCDGPVSVMQKFTEAAQYLYGQFGDTESLEQKIASGSQMELPFDKIGVFADIVSQSALAHQKAALDPDDCAEFLFADPATMGEIIKLFVAAMPKVAETPEVKEAPETAQ